MDGIPGGQGSQHPPGMPRPGEPLDATGDVGRKGWLRLRSLAGASHGWQIGQKGLPGTGQASGGWDLKKLLGCPWSPYSSEDDER